MSEKSRKKTKKLFQCIFEPSTRPLEIIYGFKFCIYKREFQSFSPIKWFSFFH